VTPGREASRGWVAATAAASAGVAFLLLLPGLLFGPSQDAAVYAAVATRLRAGAALYAEAWDHKPPGAYLIDAGAQAALPWFGPWVPIWIASWLAVAAAGLLTGWTLRRMGYDVLVQGAGGLFVVAALALPPIALGGGHTEHFALVPVAVAFTLAAFGSRNRSFLGAGILLGLGLATSLQVVPAVIAVVGVAWMRPAPRYLRLSLIAAGLSALLVVTLAALAAGGLLPDAWDAVVRYSAAYRAMNLQVHGPVFSGALGAGILASAVVMIPVGLGILAGLRAPASTRVACIGCILWLAAGAGWIGFQGRIEGHYVALVVFPVGILLALGIQQLREQLAARPRSWLIFGIPLLVLGIVSGVVVTRASTVVWDELKAINGSASAVAEAIRSSSSDTDTVFVWGNRPQIYFLADRLPASRYLYLAPLTTPGYSSPEQIQEVLTSWEAAAPAFIVDAGSPGPGIAGLPPLLIERPLAAYGRDYDVLDPLREFVRGRYVLLGVFEGWPVYELAGHDAGQSAS